MSEPNWVALGQSAVTIDYVGVWGAGATYKAGDVVVHNGVQYLAVNPSTGQTPPAAALVGIPASLLDAKGDLIVGSADNVAARLPVGTNGQFLAADSAQAAGVRWATPSWQAYTVAWTTSGTQPVLGNGTLSGRYCQIGKLVYVNIHLVLGSTSTPGSGAFFFSLPVPDAGGVGSHGAGFLGGPATYQGALVRQEAGQQKVSIWQIIAANVTVGAAAPWTWAATHMIQASITYEAA